MWREHEFNTTSTIAASSITVTMTQSLGLLKLRGPSLTTLAVVLLISFLSCLVLPTLASTAGADLDCGLYTDCSTCTATSGCGFCVSPEVATGGGGSCLPANSSHPSTTTTCSADAFITSSHQCTMRPCATPIPPPHAAFGSCGKSTSGWYQNGQSCAFECERDYEMIGDMTLTCNDGAWSGTQACSRFDPSNFLPADNGHMRDVDWFLLVFCSCWSVAVLLFVIFLLTGLMLPHLGAPPPNLTLWNIDAGRSKLQRQQRCRRAMVCMIGVGVVALAATALGINQYAQAQLPFDFFALNVDFGAFGYTFAVDDLTMAGDESYSQHFNYPSCGDASDATLCYLLRSAILSTFCWGCLGALLSLLSTVMLLCVLMRWKRETWWKHAMRFNLSATACLLSTIIIYASTAFVLLKQLYDGEFEFQFGTSWFLLLGAVLLSGLWSCMTYFYYRPTAFDDEDEYDKDDGDADHSIDRPTRHVKTNFTITTKATTANLRGDQYGAMSEDDIFA